MTTRRLSPPILAALGAAFLVGLAVAPDPVAGAGRAQVQAGQAAAPAKPGQRGGGPSRNPNWWEDAQFRQELGLTEQKASRIARIYQDRERAMRPYADEFERADDALDAMARERGVSPYVYSVHVAKVQTLRSKLFESRDVMIYRMSLELTPEQLQKLAERDRSRRGGGGPGPGSGGPPPGGRGSGGPPPPWFQNPIVKQEIGLSEEKSKRLTAIHDLRARQMQPYLEELAREQTTLASMAKERTAPVSAYAVQAAKVHTLRSRIMESREVMEYRMSLELTPDQIQKLEHRSGPRGRRGGGPR